MTSDSLTQNKEHNFPSQILKTILDCMAQLLFLDWFLVHLYVALPDPKF